MRVIMKLIAATFAFALLLTGAALAGGDNGPSKTELTLFGKDPGDARALACYTRSYDATHLSAHPKQNVTNMSLLIDSTWSYPTAWSAAMNRPQSIAHAGFMSRKPVRPSFSFAPGKIGSSTSSFNR